MSNTQYAAGLAELREVRDEIKPLARQLAKLQSELGKLQALRDRKIVELGAFEKAKADRIATSAGVSVIDVVALVPSLGPQAPASAPAEDASADSPGEDRAEPQAATQAIKEPVGALAPAMNRASQPQAAAEDGNQPSQEPRPEEPLAADDAAPAPPAASAPAPAAARPALAEQEGGETQERQLPSIPAGEEGDRWFTVTPGLLSTRPNFKQTARQMAFLDASTGVLVWQDQSSRLDLGQGSVAEILTAVYATVPASVERIYITAGDPWRRDAERHEFVKDAVAEWLNGPLPEGWQEETSRGRDRDAGHFIPPSKPNQPVGRWQRGEQHVEIRSVAEWFEPSGADPATVREAFVLLWRALHHHWPDVVIMGSPSQTGRDLWTRTIPAKAGAKWADGFPVMSEEIRGLLHATAGQGRTELLTPPRVPEQLPQWAELDRTFAYAKHTWTSGVGAPRRFTARAFAALPDKEQQNLLFSPSHWQVRVTIPESWDHVGLLPAPAPGERAWHYPHQAGRTFVTWAGGAEVNLALRNPVLPWRIEILDGLVWEKGEPLKGWATKLKEAWASLQAQSELTEDEGKRTAARLASRAVRSILLYGIGAFAQRPRITTGSMRLGAGGTVPEIPDGAQITGISDTHVSWQRHEGFTRNPYAHPEWAAGVWSAARAALLSTSIGAKDPSTGKPVKAGALHLPAGSIVAFRTDAIYTTAEVDWPYSGQPGDYLVKGRMPGPVVAPRTEEEFYARQTLGRQALESEGQ
ncbi:Mucin-19 [Streptomyces sp. NPDC021354]|uniref:Mucin-19 n=1 Tax=Streptomyces sp. NPDC021354 TaxID=3154793 RepID=UPI0033FA4937